MSVKLCVLASGSKGNCIYVASESTRILVDAGLSGRETERRLESIGERLEDLVAVCLTHEHDDHKSCLGVLHRRLGMALYANEGTIEGVEQAIKTRGLPWNIFTTGFPFEVGDLSIHPFSVPHDTYDPVGFVISQNDIKVGVVTDMGMPTELIRNCLRECQVIVIETNHDEAMLRESDRPWSLKQRIAGRRGHLSNEQAGKLLSEIAGSCLKTVFLAHLSAECNTPVLAERTVRRALEAVGHKHVDLFVTHPDRPSEVVVL